MISYVIRRILLVLVTLFGISLVTFTIVALAPGDRAPSAGASEEAGHRSAQLQRKRERFIKQYHLDKPLPVRFLYWLGRTARLDFVESWHVEKGKPVLEIMWRRMGPTVQLNLISMVLVYIIAVPLGVCQALRRNTWFDYLSTVVTFALRSIPSYAVGTLIVVYFCSKEYFNIFPLGLTSPRSDEMPFFVFLADRLWRLTPAVICATYGSFAFLSKLMRGALLENLRADYVRTARAKGLSEGRVVIRHALRNSLLPLITVAASILPAMLAGSVVIEKIFDIKGLGMMSWDAIFNRDEPIVMAVATISAFLVLLSLLVVDLLYAKVDPRISYA